MDENKPFVSIIMRSYNDIEHIGDTLKALQGQSFQNFELWNHDSSSLDGTLACIMEANSANRIFVNDPEDYIPGKILNHAMDLCGGDIIVFLNSDATPLDPHWLERLVSAFSDPSVSAVFGKQVARDGCKSLFAEDTDRAFGDGSVSAEWIHFFSMANAAARREILEEFAFATDLQYSEDIEWSLRLKRAGHRIRYVQDAVVMHSHNYSLGESYRRHYGEGKAESRIFTNGELKFTMCRYLLMPLVMAVGRDIKYALSFGHLGCFFHSIPLRLAQKIGRWKGMRAGFKELESVHI